MAKNKKRNRSQGVSTPPIEPGTGTAAERAERAKQDYDALYVSSRRTPPALWNMGRSEDSLLQGYRKLQASELIRELCRNDSILNYVIETHLSHVCGFTLAAKTQDEVFNKYCYKKYDQWKNEMDYSERLGLEEFIETVERCRLIDGDVAVLAMGELGSGKYRIIESRFIGQLGAVVNRGIAQSTLDGCVSGVHFDKGRYRGLDIRWENENGGETEFFDSDVAKLIAYRKYYEDARGISPLLPAANRFIDVMENIEFALGKAKISQLVGLVLNTNMAQSTNQPFDFKEGHSTFNLAVGETANFITAGTPKDVFQEFMEQVLALAFACIGIPYSFYSGVNHVKIQDDNYRRIVAAKQKPLLSLLDWAFRRELYYDQVLILGRSEVEFEGLMRDVNFVGNLYSQSYILENINEIGKAILTGLISDSNLMEIFGIRDNPDMEQLRLRIPEGVFVNTGFGRTDQQKSNDGAQ